MFGPWERQRIGFTALWSWKARSATMSGKDILTIAERCPVDLALARGSDVTAELAEPD
jgi:hypothetical protein